MESTIITNTQKIKSSDLDINILSNRLELYSRVITSYKPNDYVKFYIMGVEVSFDEFYQGHSNLIYLKLNHSFTISYHKKRIRRNVIIFSLELRE